MNYDPNSETVGRNVNSSGEGSSNTQPQQGNAMVAASTTQSQGSTMSNAHLSGSDPMMFPGIFTRGHRSGSIRDLSSAGEGADRSNTTANDH